MKVRIAAVRLREAGQVVEYHVDDAIELNDHVIVEADRGMDYGEVIEIKEIEVSDDRKAEIEINKTILRKMTSPDDQRIHDNELQAQDAMKICARKIREYQLPMKLVNAEYSFDKKKIIFYFTAEGRIDFRELVKDLAKIYKIRIEMRQIGVRDEARIFGGVGSCGQKLCCVRFLKNFEPVSMKMAKTQRLPLSSGKISGICGRLMCCISYEYKTYKELAKGLPKEGQIIDTEYGKAKVNTVNVLKRVVSVELEDGRIEYIFFDKQDKPEA